jgi:hypothetical protein
MAIALVPATFHAMARIMTISIIRPGIMLLLSSSLLFSIAARAEGSPHWSATSCKACHVESAPFQGAANIKAVDVETLCESCHGDRGDALPCRHASGVPIGEYAVSETLQSSLRGDQIVCSTCHDVVYQCEHPQAHYSLQNRGFLRDRTSRHAADFCAKCHDESNYEKLSPHAGVAGSPPKPTCSVCHASLPEQGSTGQLVVDFNMKRDLNDTCRGCHDVRPHPTGMTFGSPQAADEWIHLVTPSAVVLDSLRDSAAETGIELPLNPQNGEIFCATCHNPHDFKVGGEHGSQESGMKARLRQHDICQVCHEK